jgi:hypothetical protein
MTGPLVFLTIGSLLLVALFVLLRRSGSSENKISGPTQAYEALDALQSELLPDWFVDRLFSKEDREFARNQEAPEILHLFENERKSVALSWLKQTQDYVAQLMDFHVRLSRQRPDLRPSTEIKLTLEYAQFQFLCKLLAAMIRIVGPVHVRTFAEHAAGMATRLGEASEKVLASLDENVPVKVVQN